MNKDKNKNREENLYAIRSYVESRAQNAHKKTAIAQNVFCGNNFAQNLHKTKICTKTSKMSAPAMQISCQNRAKLGHFPIIENLENKPPYRPIIDKISAIIQVDTKIISGMCAIYAIIGTISTIDTKIISGTIIQVDTIIQLDIIDIIDIIGLIGIFAMSHKAVAIA